MTILSRRRSAAVTAAALVAATVPLALAAPANAVTYTVSGSIYNTNSSTPVADPTGSVSFALSVPAGTPGAVYDPKDNKYYGDDEIPGTVQSNGSYSASLPPGTYRAEFYDDSADLSYITYVTVTNGPKTLDGLMKTALKCTTAGNQTGEPRVGKTLTAVPGTFAPSYSHTLTYQWYRVVPNGSGNQYDLIAGATGASYTLTPAERGFKVEVDVTGFSTYGYNTCDWTNSPTIAAGQSAQAQGVAPAGKPKVGKILTAPSVTLPVGGSATYQWFRVKKGKHHKSVTQAIAGAVGPTYKLKKKDKGTKVYVVSTVSAPGYDPATATSGQVKVH